MKNAPGRLIAPPWQSKPHRLLFEACAACLALYLAYAAFLGRSALFASAAETVAALLWFLLIAAGLFAGLRALAGRWKGLAAPARRGRGRPGGVFAGAAGGGGLLAA
jgi:hypothetical protein